MFQNFRNRKTTIWGVRELLVTRYGSYSPYLEGLRPVQFELDFSFPISLQIEKVPSLGIAKDDIHAKISFWPAIPPIHELHYDCLSRCGAADYNSKKKRAEERKV